MKKSNILSLIFFISLLSSCDLKIKYGSDILFGESNTPSSVTINDSTNSLDTTSLKDSEVINDSILSISEQSIQSYIHINNEEIHIDEGDLAVLDCDISKDLSLNDLEFEILDGEEFIQLMDNNSVYGVKEGTAHIVAHFGEIYSNVAVINVQKIEEINVSLTIYCTNDTLNEGESTTLYVTTMPNGYEDYVTFEIISGSENGHIEGNTFFATSEGYANIIGTYNNWTSNSITISISASSTIEDPYLNVNQSEFYANYTPATSYLDSYYRSLHNLMSGSIDAQDQVPTIEANRPIIDGKFVKNKAAYFSSDNNTYFVLDASGVKVNEIYRGGAYVTLEEVAAYIYAFGDVPSNYISDNKATVSNYPWGEYLRLNHTYFSGDNSRYPYEPALPRISGIGNGDLKYYEVDIGTTGTDCDPSYTAAIYNNGYKITRGAARIVYSRYYNNYNNTTIDLSDRYVFYTYNHYNDFQEYLNYQYGWGEMFGNITGGGTLSSKTNYNPTPYVEIYEQNFSWNNYRVLKQIYIKKKLIIKLLPKGK